MLVCWVTCDVGEPAETARITPSVSARASGISSGAAARAVRRRLSRRFAPSARLPKPPSISVTLAPLHSASTAGASVTPLLNSYRVDSKSYLIHHKGLPHEPMSQFASSQFPLSLLPACRAPSGGPDCLSHTCYATVTSLTGTSCNHGRCGHVSYLA